MWKKYAVLIVVAILLATAYLLFTINILSIPDIVGQILQEFRNIILTEVEPEYVRLIINVLEVDLNHSLNYVGNETGTPYPLMNTYVVLSGEFRSTDRYGRASFIVPKGIHSLMVVRYGRTWTTNIDVKSDGEIKIIFYLFRVEASSIEVNPKPFEGLSRVKMLFNLPSFGEYYVGKPTITYYTPWGQLRIYYGDAEVIIGTDIEEVWKIVDISFLRKEIGGTRIEFIEDVKGFPTYVLPWYTFLPVVRVEVEEEWYQ
ncbi:MAG: hypothetical protein NZ929_03755 [Aigarchaeota archaeon]|nr:hypothetical protein [Aigarchaeota archaeon]MCX8192803.1 hypothetical protein [Nitrososphaeria archaeon]MDW7986047.1 hypothetical protein [Nitrososphaerota archaeon]